MKQVASGALNTQKSNSVDRYAAKKKKLGNLQEPKKINVVKNNLFDTNQNPIGILGEANKDLNIVQSIGSTIHHRGSFSPDSIKEVDLRKGRQSKSKDKKKEKTRSPILKNKKAVSPQKKYGVQGNAGESQLRVQIKQSSPERMK